EQPRAALIFQPGPRQAVQAVAATRSRLAVALLEDVKGAVDVYSPSGEGWSARRLRLPKDANISLVDTSDEDESLFVTAEAFLDPTSLWLADGASGAVQKVKALPARFN